MVFQLLPSQAGAQSVNKLPNSINSAPILTAFKTRLKAKLIANA